MKIIDRRKDFYDFYSGIYNDTTVVFDRRDAKILTDDYLIVLMSEYITHSNTEQPIGSYFIFKIGYSVWIIKSIPIQWYKDSPFWRIDKFKLEIIAQYKDYNKSEWFWGKIEKSFSLDYLLSKRKIISDTQIIDIVQQKQYKLNCPIKDNKFIIFNKSSLPTVLEPLQIYLAFEEYFSSQNNDKIISEPTDQQKIINKGFDTKYSFRGNK